MMWIYDREPLREHRPGPPAGGRTWEETLAGVEPGSDNLDRKKLKKKNRLYWHTIAAIMLTMMS